MRTASELIEHLEGKAIEACRSTDAVIHIGIAVRSQGDSSRVVWREHEDRQATLDALMKNGGEPIGLVLITDGTTVAAKSGKVTVSSALYEDCDPKAQLDLTEISRDWAFHFRDQLAECGDTRMTDFSVGV